MRQIVDRHPRGCSARVLGLALLLAIPLLLLVVNQRQEVIATTLWYIMWLGNLVQKAVPQHAYWVLFVLVALAIAVASLVRRKAHGERSSSETSDHLGRVQQLAQVVRGADRSLYLKWQLARLLGWLVLDSTDYRLPADNDGGVLARFLEDERHASPEVRDYLVAGLDRWPYERTGCITRIKQLLRVRAPVGALDLDPEEAIRFLEDQLEISHDS